MSSISSASISAARGRHVAQHPLDDLGARAAQGEREILRLDLLEHELDRAVVELQHVLEDEEQRAHLVGELARRSSAELLEDVPLGRPVDRVQDVGERLHAAGGRVLLLGHDLELVPHHARDLA